jgi:hypothetical protein
MDLPAPDLHDLANRDRLVTSEIENPFENQIGIEPSSTEGGCVACLECKRQQGSGVKCAMVIGIARQDKAMGQGFDVLVRRLCHARRVPRHENGIER